MSDLHLAQDTVLGVFSDRQTAETAINELEHQGYDPKKMSIVMKDAEVAQDMGQSTGATVADGAASGAVTGGVIGGVAGLLIGVGAIAIPGIGGVLIGGPIAAALGLTGAAATTATGAMTGAVAGGIVGALVSLGVPENEAQIYEQRVKEGAILLAVPTLNNSGENSVSDILASNGATQIRTLTAQ